VAPRVTGVPRRVPGVADAVPRGPSVGGGYRQAAPAADTLGRGILNRLSQAHSAGRPGA
jgi:hypothetical protein